MNITGIFLMCWGCFISLAVGDWTTFLKTATHDIISTLYEDEILLARSAREHLRRGIFEQWVSPTNFTYDYIRSNIDFYLYTRQNTLHGQELWPEHSHSIEYSHFQPWKQTALLIHGFGVDSTSDSVQLIKEKLLEVHDLNVIGVDYGKLMDHWWYELCSPCGMAVVVLQAPKIGWYIGELIGYLVERGQSPDNVHLVGHSLGAHVAGFAGKFLHDRNISVARITGLDPSSPGFTKVSDYHRLAADDAEFTDCMYTSAKSISVRKPLCQANFYPNGCGKSQPGCYSGDFRTYGGCSHSRVIYLFAESIEPQSVFPARRCNGIPCLGSGTMCWPSDSASMGYQVDTMVRGIYYTETNGAYPFSKERNVNVTNA